MMETLSYLNPMQYDQEQQTYKLKMPDKLLVFAEGRTFQISVVERLNGENLIFDCITSYEDYNYVLEGFVKRPLKQPKSDATVLVLYFDQERCLHATMAIRVSIIVLFNNATSADVTYSMDRKVMAFQEWQTASSA